MGRFVDAVMSNPYCPFCTPKFVPEAWITGSHNTTGTNTFVVMPGLSLGVMMVLEENSAQPVVPGR